MANGLTQAQKDEANAQIKQIVANGGGQAEIDAFKADFEAKLSAAGGQTDAPAQPTDTDLASDDSSSDFPSYKDLNDQKQVGKQPRRDEDGEVINLAEEFGDFGAAIESIPFFGDFIDDMWGAVKTGRTQARAVDDNLNLFKEGADISDEDLTEYIARAEEMQDRPPSKEMQDFNRIYEEEGGGAWGFIKGIALNPSVAFETMTSSIIAMANPAGLAAGGAGAAAGAGVGTLAAGPVGTGIGAVSGMMAGLSGTLDAALSTQEFLQEEVEHAGLNFDREGIRAILENPEALSRIRTKAAARGTVVGLVDGITGGIAGKVGVQAGKLARKVGKTAKAAKRAAGGAALGVEAAGGGLGETGARLAAGQELDAREIGLEIVGEFASATPIASTARKIVGKQAKEEEVAKINGQELDTEEVSQFVNEATDQDIIFSDVEVQGDPAAETKYKERRYGVDFDDQKDFLTDEEKSTRDSFKKEIDDIGVAAKGASPEVKATLLEDVKDIQKEFKQAVREQNRRVGQMSAVEAQQFQEKNKDITKRKNAIQVLQDQKNEENGPAIDKAIARQQEKIAETQEEVDTIAGASQAKVEEAKAKYQQQKQAKEAEETAIAEEEEIAQADPVALQQKEAKQEIINEDVQDNTKNYEGITDMGRDLGVFEVENTDPATSSVEENAPLTKKGKTFTQGDFVKKLKGAVPSLLDYNQLKYDMEKQARSQGFEITIPEPQNAEIDAEGQPIFTAEISKPREESLTKQVESVAAPQEEAVEGEEAVQEEERQPVDYATDIAKEAGAEVTETTPGTFDLNVGPESATSERRAAHKLLNGLKKRGHKEAKLVEGPDGNFQVVAGPRETGPQVEYNLDESRIPELTEQIKASRPGKITHQRARNLAIEQLRRERDGAPDVEYNLEEPSNLTQEADQESAPKNFKRHQDLSKVAGNRVQMNIGLENNPKNYEGIIAELAKNPAVRLGSTEQVDGEYNGEPERTLVVNAKYDGTAAEFRKYVEGLNKNLTQEAIGSKFNGRGALIYDPAYKGDKYDFNNEFFLSPSRDVSTTEDIEGARRIQTPRKIPGGRKPQAFADRDLVDVNLEKRKQEYIAGTRGDRIVGPEDPNIVLGKDAKEVAPQGEELTADPAQQERVKSRIAELEKIKKSDPDLFTPKQQKTIDLLKKKDKELSEGPRSFAREKDLGKATKGKELSNDLIGDWANNKTDANTQEAILSSIRYADAVARRASRSKNIDQDLEATLTEDQVLEAQNRKSLDPDISQEIQTIVSEAFATGKVGGQTFNPTNAQEAKQQLGGLIRDAVRNYYLKEGAPYGTTGRHTKSNARLNKIRSAIRQLEKTQGVQAEGTSKVGGKGATKAVKIDTTDPTAVADLLNEGFHTLQNGKRVFKQDVDITPDQVQDALAAEAQFEGSPLEEGTALDEILPASEIEARGDTQVSNILGVEGITADSSLNEIADSIDYKTLKNNYKKIAKAVTADLPGARKVADYFKRKFIDNEQNLAKPQRAFKQEVAKFIAAEPAGLGKPKREGTRSAEFSLEAKNPNFTTEFDTKGIPFNKINQSIAPFLDRAANIVKGNKFASVVTHRSPEKKAKIKRLAEAEGFVVENHPLNPGEVLLLAPGKTINDVLKFQTSRDGKALDADPRDFTKLDSEQNYEGFDDTSFKELLDSRDKHLGDRNYGRLNKIDQLPAETVAEIKDILESRGFQVDAYKSGKESIIDFSRDADFSIRDTFNPLSRADKSWLDRILPVLKKAFPGVTITADAKSFNEAIDSLPASQRPKGTVNGMYLGGRIVLNPATVNKDTPIHEVGHIVSKMIQKENPALWRKGAELLTGAKFDANGRYVKGSIKTKGNKYLESVSGIPFYKAYLDQGNPGKFIEEVMANAIGKRGAEIFENQKDAGRWNNFINKIGDFIKKKLGVDKAYKDITLDDWVDAAAATALTGDTTAFVSPTADVSFNIEEDPAVDPDVSAATIRGKEAEGKWYTKPFKWLIPPAADDYHGLISKIKSIPKEALKKVTDAFVNDHHRYVEASTKVRKKVSDIAKKLNKAGIKLDDKNVTTINGAKLNAAQAIQAHVNGFENSFSKKPEVQEYIKAMQDEGVLKKTDRYDTASPQADIVGYVINDLYKKHFTGFNKAKNEVFTKGVMAKITSEHGEKYAKALENSLQRMSTGKTQGLTDQVTSKWNNWALGSVGTIMFLNFRSAALQLLSVGNYGFAAKNPMAFVGHMFNPNTFAEAKKLFNSSYLKERRARAGFDVNAREMLDLLGQSNNFSEFTKKVLNKGFAATSFVDSVAIAFGGAAFIKAQQGSGVSRADAIKAWKEQTEEAQQSSRPDRVSQWQTSGVSKFVLAFANTPQQYFRLGQKAFREMRQGKNVGKNLAKMGWYMAAQNMIFTGLQSASLAMLGGLDSDDDKERAEAENQYNSMLNTILRGMGLYGAVFAAIKDVGLKGIQEERKINPDHVNTALKATSISPPLNRKISDLLAIGRAQKYDKDKEGIESAEATTIAKGTTVLTNLPTDWVQKKGIAVKNLWDEQYGSWQKFLMILGYAPHTLNKKEGDEFDFDFDFDDVEFEDVEFEDVEF